MEERSEIQSFYKGKTIFITGGSGFMGKVLIEKLLYACDNLDKIYMLIRPKRGHSPDSRIEDMFKLPLFLRVRKEKPEIIKKVIPLVGDILLNNLGLTDEQRECLINETQIVFNLAAAVRLEAKLKDAIESNMVGTKRVLELGKAMKKLEAFVHLSTAFCHVDQKELGERVYDSPNDYQDVIKFVQWMEEDVVNLVTSKLIAPHPNTYTYTKCLTEKLVADEYPHMPVVITRPSIVLPAVSEPLPGWVDNLNGPIGIIIGAGKGVIRSMHCNPNYHAEVIPVDWAINALIVIAYKISIDRNKLKNCPVYNITQTSMERMTWGQILEKGKEIIYDYPFEGQIWYPDGNIRNNKFIHNLFVFFFHIIPAYLIDFLMLIFCQKRFMVHIQKKISNGLDFLQYFTTRKWIFHNMNLLILWGDMSPKDRELFQFDTTNVDMLEYMKFIILGARQYCMKEDLSSLPRARIHQRIMYIIHITTVYLFYFGIFYFIYEHCEFVQVFVDYLINKIKMLPLLGNVI
ncbi:putative fatty acyl-CoA reductase CG5065 [Vespa velutina]|uniref:putative fatty acyl-CoA reductase CG5065 n=1 Tax=Vespa velutina TaxID=202808 RepID=UPI001FB2BAB5|nr:putative fatty acyl-CoA reductase CG5065 [Vespa velutina]XP_047368536.1 putative fatty acyl-CoA reductase CG5065 [Vespa velutina]XP_047368537.1 putative fatty acyl-CoA reductase CG5065 [Vespa velutina]